MTARTATDDVQVLAKIEAVEKPPLYFHLLSALGWRGQERRLDRALQRLRKAGHIRYLKKADGGPGWSSIAKVEKKGTT